MVPYRGLNKHNCGQGNDVANATQFAKAVSHTRQIYRESVRNIELNKKVLFLYYPVPEGTPALYINM